jgi:hypothetical protein
MAWFASLSGRREWLFGLDGDDSFGDVITCLDLRVGRKGIV